MRAGRSRYGERMTRSRNTTRLAAATAVALLAPLALTGCEAGDATPDDTPNASPEMTGFTDGSPRPACEELLELDRTPYAETPVVVASDWSEPLSVAAPVTDLCPNDAISLSPDGRTLYFYWSPRVNAPAAELLAPETGTYRAERLGDDPGQFGNPVYVDLGRGANGSVDGALSFSSDGALVVFHSTRSANLGYLADPPTDDYLDLYVADLVDGAYSEARNVGAPINSTRLDGEHGLRPDGALVFASDRPGGLGGTDLYLAMPLGNGDTVADDSSDNLTSGWGEPANLGAPVNTAANEMQPDFAANSPSTMYFTSDRDGPSSIYRTTWNGTTWSEPEMVITGYVGEPTLSPDGTLLYFVHVLVDDSGVYGSNIWYVTR